MYDIGGLARRVSQARRSLVDEPKFNLNTSERALAHVQQDCHVSPSLNI
jgi:hypothetical protein